MFATGRVHQIFYHNSDMEDFRKVFEQPPGNKRYRLERIPENQRPENISDEEILMTVFHFHQIITQQHSLPFLIKLNINGVYFDDVKRRIKLLTGAKDRDFEKWKFAIRYK